MTAQKQTSDVALAEGPLGIPSASHTRAVTDAFGQWTYGALTESIQRLASALMVGGGRARPVAIRMTAEREAVAALLACRFVGRSAVLLPPHLAGRELDEVLRASRAAQLLLPPGAVMGRHPRLTQPSSTTSGVQIVALAGERDELDLPPSVIQLTSGSLGLPKLSARPWSGVQIEVQAVAECLGMSPHDRVLCASSIAHSYGLVGGLLAPLAAGAHVRLVTSPAVPRDPLWFRPTILFGLAQTYQAMLDEEPVGDSLSSLRFALSAGAPLPPGLYDAFLRRFDIPIRQDYGTTETGTIAIDTANTPDPATVGFPLPHLEVRLDSHRGISASPDSVAETQVRSAAVASTYLDGSGMQPAVDADSWYHTRDTGALDDLGRLRLGPRLRDPVVVDGTRVQPEVLEAAIRRLPGVREVAVVSTAVPGGHAAVKAVVVADVGADDVRRLCDQMLPAEHRPTQIELRGQLPRSPAGKVLLSRLS